MTPQVRACVWRPRQLSRGVDSSTRLAALLAVASGLVCVQPLRGDDLLLTTEHSAGDELTARPGETTAPLLVRVVNDTATDPPVDFLTGWQLTLRIEPAIGAKGSVEFGDVSQPPDYVFGGVDTFGIQSTLNEGDLLAFDAEFPAGGGVQVPDVPGANLLSLEFDVSADAEGTFHLLAVDGLARSEWSDAAQPFQMRRTYANLPDGGGPVTIGAILVAPEISADFDRDGDVDGDDFLQWQIGFGTASGASRSDGDADGDGDIDGDDFLAWQLAYSAATNPSGQARTVPEPSAWALAVMLGAMLTVRRRR